MKNLPFDRRKSHSIISKKCCFAAVGITSKELLKSAEKDEEVIAKSLPSDTQVKHINLFGLVSIVKK